MAERLMDRAFDEAICEIELGSLGGLDARIEAVAKGHQFIDFGDDPVLLCDRRNCYIRVLNRCQGQLRLRHLVHSLAKLSLHV